MKRKILTLILAIISGTSILIAPAAQADTSWVSGHVQNIGWIDGSVKSDGVENVTTIGTTGKSLRLEAVRGNIPAEMPFSMSGHVQNVGWEDQVVLPDGRVMIGTVGKSLRLEAVKLKSFSKNVVVYCQAHVQNIGWMSEVSNGAVCGTTGKSLRLEALKIRVVVGGVSSPEPTQTPTPTPTVTQEPSESTELIAVGDFGVDPIALDNMKAIGDTHKPLLILGDLGYTVGASIFCKELKSRVSAPVLWVQGNHENRNAKDPSQLTSEYQKCMPTYSASYGDVGIAQVYKMPNAWVITGSPNEVEAGTYLPGGTRWTWMQEQIRSAKSAGAWPIIAVHEPDYTVGEHGRPGADSEQKAISNLAKAEGVKLVLTAHDHNYSRVTVDGTTFVVSGMGGHEIRPDIPKTPYISCPGKPGYLELSISKTEIKGNVVGTCRDTFTITR